MSVNTKTTRRRILKAGLASVASAAAITPGSHAALPKDIKPKAQGETRVIFLGGDVLHNFSAQEPAIRGICEKAGWKVLSVHDARYVTPDLVSTADLLIIQRWMGSLPGWVPGPIYERAPEGDGYMSDELADAIVDNVKNRGMGFMSLHCTIWSFRKPKFMELLGVNPIIHGPLQIVRLHNFNQSHPITRGMKDFDLPLDENFGAELIHENTIPLYETTGIIDKRHDIGGWCLDQGRGRVVGFLAGHTYFAYQDPNYLPLLWRGAHWALKREIPSSN